MACDYQGGPSTDANRAAPVAKAMNLKQSPCQPKQTFQINGLTFLTATVYEACKAARQPQSQA
jgi:hypothetical protein